MIRRRTAVCVCVCVCIHMYTHTHVKESNQSQRKKERKIWSRKERKQRTPKASSPSAPKAIQTLLFCFRFFASSFPWFFWFYKLEWWGCERTLLFSPILFLSPFYLVFCSFGHVWKWVCVCWLKGGREGEENLVDLIGNGVWLRAGGWERSGSGTERHG